MGVFGCVFDELLIFLEPFLFTVLFLGLTLLDWIGHWFLFAFRFFV